MTANLLANSSGTGAGAVVPVGGGTYVVTALGTFGGATLQLELLGPDDVTWMTISGAVLTVPGMFTIALPSEGRVRMNIVGGAATGLYATIARA